MVDITKVIGTHVDHMRSCLEATLSTMFVGQCVTIYGLDHEDGHTWKRMTINVTRVTLSSCYEVHFTDTKHNTFCHHKDHNVTIEGAAL